MKIIREGPCTTHPLVLDDKNYSYWKPQMTSFFKSLDGKAWRAILARWELLTVIVDGQVVPKFELDWTDAEEQASIGNSRRFNAIFKGVDLNAFELINSCNSAKEARRILGVAYEEKISKSKIVHKVLRSLLGKFDIKVIAIDEAHDITKLKLDELFESLTTFEMTISNRDDKKGKGVAFKIVYEEETPEHKTTNEVNVNESIALLTNFFSKVKKFRNMNTIGARVREQNSFRRRDENFKRKPEERTFKYRERGGIGHYQAKCPTYLRKQKKSFCATFFDEESDDSEEEDEYTNAFISRLTEHDSI
ncbi:gag-proteinase polyprotein [Cucumis melo var. makuwa]|uniref:Gag-proteinase polyprotein n=1 Tax=Cucumis melo var. makuwa TaxID=1194695 RepID=A0A5D3BPP2_CUCMM|nr:gag-proteinase polyprotein [Cucumis melo var. makuwa]